MVVFGLLLVHTEPKEFNTGLEEELQTQPSLDRLGAVNKQAASLRPPSDVTLTFFSLQLVSIFWLRINIFVFRVRGIFNL